LPGRRDLLTIDEHAGRGKLSKNTISRIENDADRVHPGTIRMRGG
jgi:hypothetical protein